MVKVIGGGQYDDDDDDDDDDDGNNALVKLDKPMCIDSDVDDEQVEVVADSRFLSLGDLAHTLDSLFKRPARIIGKSPQKAYMTDKKDFVESSRVVGSDEEVSEVPTTQGYTKIFNEIKKAAAAKNHKKGKTD